MYVRGIEFNGNADCIIFNFDCQFFIAFVIDCKKAANIKFANEKNQIIT